MKTFEEWCRSEGAHPGLPYLSQCWDYLSDGISTRDERIKELEEREQILVRANSSANILNNELAAQNQQLREALEAISCNLGTGKLRSISEKIADEALALPDLASPILNRVKAEVLREFSRAFAVSGLGNADLIIPGDVVVALHKMADAIENREALAAIKEIE